MTGVILSRGREAYFDWLLRLVCDRRYSQGKSWRKLFRMLYETDFIPVLEMDENRASDGIELRYRFAREDRAAVPDDRPCSVLEMMAALALRCEEQITGDEDYGDRTGKWFFGMIGSMGLSDMDDARFDTRRVREIIGNFLRRDYAPDGRGGLFILRHPRRDMRNVEIWYQMMWYLDEIIYGGNEDDRND